MTSYEVSVWLAQAADAPDIVRTVQARSAAEAMKLVMQAAAEIFALKVEVRAADGLLLWRWRGVLLLSQRFMSLTAEQGEH